jgi:preflagellin peptidase FlaK
VFVASTVDLLRLLAVPILAVAAWRDVRTRRVPNEFWYALTALGVVLLAWEWVSLGSGFRRSHLVRTTLLSVAVVVPLAYAFWRFGAFGGADAKALMALAILFPTYPIVYLPSESLPLVVTSVGVFSLTILTNGVLLGMAYPLVLGVRNLLAGHLDRRMFVARPMPWRAVETTHGGLRSAPPDGPPGLDLDALRMYLRWRGTDLATLRADPALRDPETLPAETGDPTDGAVRPDLTGILGTSGAASDGRETDGQDPRTERSDHSSDPSPGISSAAPVRGDDEWGAEAFLSSLDGDAYGTSPEQLRAGLEVLVARDQVWVSPGLPFLVPLFLGLLTALTVGDLLVGVVVVLGGA